jgi:hypothetical protein
MLHNRERACSYPVHVVWLWLFTFEDIRISSQLEQNAMHNELIPSCQLGHLRVND